MIESFGKRLKQVREYQGLSREKLGEKAKVSYITIYKLEHGYGLPYLITAALLADALSTSIDYLAKGDNHEPNK
jgi:transcriptional regulator with XRE-family HTH domain